MKSEEFKGTIKYFIVPNPMTFFYAIQKLIVKAINERIAVKMFLGTHYSDFALRLS